MQRDCAVGSKYSEFCRTSIKLGREEMYREKREGVIRWLMLPLAEREAGLVA